MTSNRHISVKDRPPYEDNRGSGGHRRPDVPGLVVVIITRDGARPEDAQPGRRVTTSEKFPCRSVLKTINILSQGTSSE